MRAGFACHTAVERWMDGEWMVYGKTQGPVEADVDLAGMSPATDDDN